MALPDLIVYSTEEEYENHYIGNYCNASPIKTFDGIPVMFYPENFVHSFYNRTEKRWNAPKDKFSKERGERIDWIKCILQDPTIIPRKGYDKATNSYDNSRRVTFINDENYLVVIYINKRGIGKFITAYVIDNDSAAEKIRNSPLWENK